MLPELKQLRNSAAGQCFFRAGGARPSNKIVRTFINTHRGELGSSRFAGCCRSPHPPIGAVQIASVIPHCVGLRFFRPTSILESGKFKTTRELITHDDRATGSSIECRTGPHANIGHYCRNHRRYLSNPHAV